MRKDFQNQSEVSKSEIFRQGVKRVIMTFVIIAATILLVRFMLQLFAADASNPFVEAIYRITSPLTWFFDLVFPTLRLTGVARGIFEIPTLLAAGVWVFLGWLIARLVASPDRKPFDHNNMAI